MRTEGITQDYIAGKMEITQGAVAHWLSGRREIGLTEFFALCGHARADPKFILFGPPQRQPQPGEDELAVLLEKYPDLRRQLAVLPAPDQRVAETFGAAPYRKRWRRHPSIHQKKR